MAAIATAAAREAERQLVRCNWFSLSVGIEAAERPPTRIGDGVPRGVACLCLRGEQAVTAPAAPNADQPPGTASADSPSAVASPGASTPSHVAWVRAIANGSSASGSVAPRSTSSPRRSAPLVTAAGASRVARGFRVGHRVRGCEVRHVAVADDDGRHAAAARILRRERVERLVEAGVAVAASVSSQPSAAAIPQLDVDPGRGRVAREVGLQRAERRRGGVAGTGEPVRSARWPSGLRCANAWVAGSPSVGWQSRAPASCGVAAGT